jgi:hypothetical protein
VLLIRAMDVEKIIKQGVGVVGAILSAFGGFLLNIAPPQEAQAAFAVGVAEFILLVVFLVIRFSREYQWTKQKALRVWGRVAGASVVIFICVVPIYYKAFQNAVYVHEDGALFVKGDQLTDYAENIRKIIAAREGVVPDARLMRAIGNPHDKGTIEKVWTSASIKWASFKLVFIYVAVIVSIGCAILALTALWGVSDQEKQTA